MSFVYFTPIRFGKHLLTAEFENRYNSEESHECSSK